ncbi:MAG: hypothetical protein AAGL66_07750 [Pseudomonadota bacterium]
MLQSTKWYLWHGEVERALETLDDGCALASDLALHDRNQSKLAQHLIDMVKKQQMQWSRDGARSLLQTRTSVLNGDLRSRFEKRHPEMKGSDPANYEQEPVKLAAQC